MKTKPQPDSLTRASRGITSLWRSLPRLLVAPVLLTICGCTSLYNHLYRPAALADASAEFDLHFVEADEAGWLWDKSQANQTIDAIQASVADADTYVLLFVHGWHHSAACCDDNVEGFKETLHRLYGQLAAPNPNTESASVQPPLKLIGIYVGWRGRSLPGWLDYLTFWNRKSVAEKVGRTDVREYLARLNHLYEQHDKLLRSAQTPHFLGLVTIGHSFGADVVLRAVASTMEDSLERVNSTPAYLRGARPSQPPLKVAQPIRGYGDLTVLVNPAVETSAYQRLNILSRGLSYPPGQTPILLTVSADNDHARHSLFRYGRILGEWLTRKPHIQDREEREMERQALGVYGEKDAQGSQITHRLQASDNALSLKSSRISHRPETACGNEPCLCEWLDWRSAPQTLEPDTVTWDATAAFTVHFHDPALHLEDYDFSSNSTSFHNVKLSPLPGAIPYQPLIVATAASNVIDNHNGIFTTPFVDFLVRYVSLIEAKQYLNSATARRLSPRDVAK